MNFTAQRVKNEISTDMNDWTITTERDTGQVRATTPVWQFSVTECVCGKNNNALIAKSKDTKYWSVFGWLDDRFSDKLTK